eukprot:Blabericola_migrator_1__561@NODE_1139_length_5305_cov_64_109393_g775_i0_p2_GENE_NODE_1139_length_5305_cov_64_109393_g775_i0NODE_1139_length_5305_cov_64_109393_g775_i0_p2_ORF_typecomplete_len268_score29_00Fboxlike/PF12937_7/7_7e05Fbox/PF00646_33/0_0029Fbox/PF00646_33/3e03Fbox_5/PF18511_1/0_12_NODE_1139_length_5305_cov_64_109393_g775_i02691072
MQNLPHGVVNVLISYLTATERFNVSRVCRVWRQLALCDTYEAEAMMQYLFVSELYERPWRYSLPETESTLPTLELAERNAEHMSHIKSWHCLLVRTLKLAPWTIKIDIDGKPTKHSQRIEGDLAEGIGLIWTHFLSRLDAGPVTYPAFIGHMKGMREMTPQRALDEFYQFQRLEIHRSVGTTKREPSASSDNLKSGPSMLDSHFPTDTSTLFSWKYVVAPVEELVDPTSIGTVAKLHWTWLSEISEEYILPVLTTLGCLGSPDKTVV